LAWLVHWPKTTYSKFTKRDVRRGANLVAGPYHRDATHGRKVTVPCRPRFGLDHGIAGYVAFPFLCNIMIAKRRWFGVAAEWRAISMYHFTRAPPSTVDVAADVLLRVDDLIRYYCFLL
jgi:hypothetical protein